MLYPSTRHRELSGRVLDSDQWAAGFSLTGVTVLWSSSKTHLSSLVLAQPGKTSPFLTERLLMRCKESNQTKSTRHFRCLELVQPRKTGPNMTEKLLMGTYRIKMKPAKMKNLDFENHHKKSWEIRKLIYYCHKVKHIFIRSRFSKL